MRYSPLQRLQSSGHLEREKLWPPEGSIDCPRKRSQIANDRCLEYQAADGCRCPNAAGERVAITRRRLQAAALREEPPK